MLPEENPIGAKPLLVASFQIFPISDRIYSLKLMESELAFRFASRCNAAGRVIAIRRESRRGRPVLFAPLAPRAPRLFACIRCTNKQNNNVPSQLI